MEKHRTRRVACIWGLYATGATHHTNEATAAAAAAAVGRRRHFLNSINDLIRASWGETHCSSIFLAGLPS